MSVLTIKVDAAELRSALDLLRARCRDLTPAMKVIGNMVVSSVIENFDTGRSPEGQPWKPSKRVLKHGGQTLIKDGGLWKSIRRDAEPNRVVVSSSGLDYAAIHQTGGVIARQASQRTLFFKTFKRGPRKGRTLFAKERAASHSMLANVGAYSITIPARPYMGVKDRDWPDINREILRWFRNG